MKLSLISGNYSVYRFAHHEEIPLAIFTSDSFISITRTEDEMSVVCETGLCLDGHREEAGWKLLKIDGPLDFTMVGVVASFSAPLAREKISIFVISTYDTDYLMVKNDKLAKAREVLTSEGFAITGF